MGVCDVSLPNARELTKRLEALNDQLDKADTLYIANIRNIINKTYFADIESEQQRLDNQGNVFYRDSLTDTRGNKWEDIGLDYIVFPERLGVFYGRIYEAKDKNGAPQKKYKAHPFSNYSRFIADVLSEKVLYSRELEHFIIKEEHTYTAIMNENDFYNRYEVIKKHVIKGFLQTFEELFQNHIDQQHGYTIEPFMISGKDWLIDIESNDIKNEKPKEKYLYFDFYDVPFSDIEPNKAKGYIEMVGGTPNSIHNTMLLHAYVMKRKMNLISPEQWFLFKDFGRTGKGLFFKTFNGVFNIYTIAFNTLIGGGFDAGNEMRNLYGADLAHANETGEISGKQMNLIRKFATGETVTARTIGGNSFSFKVESVFALDTNEDTDIGGMLANTSRTVMIGFRDRPANETAKERRALFAPYWKFIVDKKETRIEASLSFLINSIQYLKSCGNVFDFEEVSLKNYYSADQLTETQQLVLRTIHEQGFVLSGDETLQQAITDDYKSLRFNKAKDDFRKIGVAINQAKFIEGKTYKVHTIDDETLFEEAYSLLD